MCTDGDEQSGAARRNLVARQGGDYFATQAEREPWGGSAPLELGNG